MNAKVSYEKLYKLMDRKGESFASLVRKGVLRDHSSRVIKSGKPVNIEHIANVCKYFTVPIEEVVEVIIDEDETT